MNLNSQRITSLADGQRSAKEIAEIVGVSANYVKKYLRTHNLPRKPRGAQRGQKNPQFRHGRIIQSDGYALVLADHPNARKSGYVLEHRLAMEKRLGRYLKPEEVVDHIDGLVLHNAPENLQLFQNNGEHLRHTISGTTRNWTPRGFRNIGRRTDRGIEIEPVDIYRQRKKRGDVRLRQILLAALKLGIDSPFLLGTHHHLEKAGIDPHSRSSLERALADLVCRYEQDHLP